MRANVMCPAIAGIATSQAALQTAQMVWLKA